MRRFDAVHVHAVGEDQQLVSRIAPALSPPADQALAGFQRRRGVGAKAGPVRDPVRRFIQKGLGAEGVGQNHQKVAAVVLAPPIQHLVGGSAKCGVIGRERGQDHGQLMTVGADRLQIMVHRQQDVG